MLSTSEELQCQDKIAFIIVSYGPPPLDTDAPSQDEDTNKQTLDNPSADEVVLVHRPYSLKTDNPFRHRLKWVTMFDLMIYFYDPDALKAHLTNSSDPITQAPTKLDGSESLGTDQLNSTFDANNSEPPVNSVLGDNEFESTKSGQTETEVDKTSESIEEAEQFIGKVNSNGSTVDPRSTNQNQQKQDDEFDLHNEK